MPQRYPDLLAPSIPGPSLHCLINEDYSSSSDVDLYIVIDGDMPENTRHVKFDYKGIILEPSYDSIQQYRTPDQLLASNFLAFHFRVPNIISDP